MRVGEAQQLEPDVMEQFTMSRIEGPDTLMELFGRPLNERPTRGDLDTWGRRRQLVLPTDCPHDQNIRVCRCFGTQAEGEAHFRLEGVPSDVKMKDFHFVTKVL